MKIILASASPRRKDIMESLDVKFDIIVGAVDESIDQQSEPEIVVKELAYKKAVAALNKVSTPSIIIAADTIVVGEEILGKPKDSEHATKMLNSLSGKSHRVMTGIVIIDNQNNNKVIHCETTRVFFKELTADEIQSYINTGEHMDKAGAYAIQGKAALFVKKIEGDYNNVVGLPIYILGELLHKHFNIHLL